MHHDYNVHEWRCSESSLDIYGGIHIPHAKVHRGLLVSKYVVISDDTRLNFNLSLYMHGDLVDGKLNTTK